MDSVQEITNLAVNNGVAICVIIFFMYRDIKFTSQLQNTLVTLVDAVTALKDCVDEFKTFHN